MASKLAFSLVVALSALGAVQGYSGGAPPETCEDMTPKHPYTPKKTPIPYTVKVNSESVSSGGVVKLTISGKETFKGFLVQVRKGDDPVGKFLVPEDEKYTKTINCGKGEQNAVTHKNSEPKNNHPLSWQAPADLKGEVQVYVTVAKDGSTYWVRKPLATIKVV